MQFQLPFHIAPAPVKIQHTDAVMLCGSCFTEHIGNQLSTAKMRTYMNPQGILFNPMSIAACLDACMESRVDHENDLFRLNEIWNHWDFHSRFSNIDKELAVSDMNHSIKEGAAFLRQADWLIITFGSSYQYFLSEDQATGSAGRGVGNCHKAPGNWFQKRMLEINDMHQQWTQVLNKLKIFNPALRIIFTISPVRHYRDGLVENNRSKARLFELVHRLTAENEHTLYFPAFELVNDILRDYRFFEKDMVHPSQQATQFVWEQFVKTWFSEEGIAMLQQISDITTALHHKPRFEQTQAHQQFLESLQRKITALQQQFPHVNFDEELRSINAYSA